MEKDNCLTGKCPPVYEPLNPNVVKLSEGSGGREMNKLIHEIKDRLGSSGNWNNHLSDAASVDFTSKKLFFTTDSYIVTPLFFPGGNIGKIAFCGTVNDISVMGARPIGISLSLVIEEGLSKDDLFRIISTIGNLSKMTGIPVVTGDTKVMEKGSVDKLIITTSGVGEADKDFSETILPGDVVIVSGGIGEHGASLLSKRFELESSIETDSKPLVEEMSEIRTRIKIAKDITRGGISSVLNEISEKSKMQIFVHEDKIPMLKEVRALTEILGIDAYSLACEGRLVCIASEEKSVEVLEKLKKFNSNASIIGQVTNGSGVIVQTKFGKKILPMPSGNIVPRIC